DATAPVAALEPSAEAAAPVKKAPVRIRKDAVAAPAAAPKTAARPAGKPAPNTAFSRPPRARSGR
ncbi:MAG TPA: hypothetical protein VJO99_06095, partial [Burkholderiaceae bacterium]|nr:hypothetical protein [Burkholderiaceae bacterium]